jgi:hypothetical protein
MLKRTGTMPNPTHKYSKDSPLRIRSQPLADSISSLIESRNRTPVEHRPRCLHRGISH